MSILDDVRMADFMASRSAGVQKTAENRGPTFAAREPDVPIEPPSLSGIREIELDFETSGVRWWAGDRPGGCGLRLPDGSTRYLAWGHRGGGNNLSEEAAREWFRREVRGKHITNISTGFEVHMASAWGIDLEDQDNEVSDIAHWAALIDDHRIRFSLEALCGDWLADERKVTSVNGVALDMSRAMDYPASIMAIRAEADVRQVGLLKPLLWRKLNDLGLQRVRALEDKVIYAACEMEKNSAPIDEEKLKRWTNESAEELDVLRREIAKDLGVHFQESLFEGAPPGQFLNPDSGKQMTELFRKLDLPLTYGEPTKANPEGNPSFAAEVLAEIDHPIVKKIVRQGKLLDLRSKYLLPWSKSVAADGGVLRFKLHQCRGDEHGTVRGRFSASSPGGGSSPHQVMKPSKQRKATGDRYILRELFIPAPGELLVSADAMQIEYRIFASYTGSKALREAYAANPMLQFHQKTREMVQVYKPDLDYDKAKTLNFLTVYGGGPAKLALQLGEITKAQFTELHRQYASVKYGIPRNHPLLARAMEIKKIYDRALPEVGPLSKRARELVKERGYVMDVLGRRATFPNGYGAHGALNAIIQPSAAEVMKTKMVEVHVRRRELGLTPRLTVHDEWVGGCPSRESAEELSRILNHQSFKEFEKIPILWDVKVGKNWASCTSELEAEFEAGLREDEFEGTVNDGTRAGRDR